MKPRIACCIGCQKQEDLKILMQASDVRRLLLYETSQLRPWPGFARPTSFWSTIYISCATVFPSFHVLHIHFCWNPSIYNPLQYNTSPFPVEPITSIWCSISSWIRSVPLPINSVSGTLPVFSATYLLYVCKTSSLTLHRVIPPLIQFCIVASGKVFVPWSTSCARPFVAARIFSSLY